MFDFLAIVFTVVLLLLIGVPVVLYKIPKRFGRPRLGKILVAMWFGLIALSIVSPWLKELFFTKRDAKKILLAHGIELKDDFHITGISVPDAFARNGRTVIDLKVSRRDYDEGIARIKAANDFCHEDSMYDIEQNLSNAFRYNGPAHTHNYLSDECYGRAYLKPNGTGYAPAIVVITFLSNDTAIEIQTDD